MKTQSCRIKTATVLLALAIGVASAMAQPQQRPPMPPPDGVAQLNEALAAAGAPALAPAQESALRALIGEFRGAGPKAPDAALAAARAAYENAILNGDAAAAANQARIIANAQAADMLERETDAALFAINALTILKADAAQYGALIAKLGENGLLRLVLNLAGGGPGGGPGRGARGGPGGPGGFGGARIPRS